MNSITAKTDPQDGSLQALVNSVEAVPLLKGRYKNMKHVPVKRGGKFSVIFLADDLKTGKKAILKFYQFFSPDTDEYREKAFEREPVLLRALVNKRRCLQLYDDMDQFPFRAKLASGPTITVQVKYFVTEYLAENIEPFFYEHDKFTAEQRLDLFHQLLLAVQALHAQELAHRDLKADNFRAYMDALQRVVVAIDFGCAALAHSPAMFDVYDDCVGWKSYAPPEARCGLATVHTVTHETDIYALGCLLFELFTPDSHWAAYKKHNPRLEENLLAMRIYLDNTTTDAERLVKWADATRDLSRCFNKVLITDTGSTVPTGIGEILQDLFERMTDPDYTKRPSLKSAVTRVQITLKVLRHEREDARRRERRQALRAAHRAKQLDKDSRRKALTR